MHEYPFSIVEHEYFVDFIKSLRPTFPLKSHITVRKDILGIFSEEWKRLYELFKNVNARFSATMDMWTSNQNKGYMCITVHWVDDNWCIQKRIIKFLHVKGRHTGINLANVFSSCLHKWFIEKKMFSLTLDNAAANDVCVKDVIRVLNRKSPLVSDGTFFHVRCACHILNLVARDGLAHIGQAVLNIRSFVILVKCSPLQKDEFMKCASESGLDTTRGLSTGVLTRWNSTYHMLSDAIYYRKAFERLYEIERELYDEALIPKAEDWNKATTLGQCLKRFDDITNILSGTSYPTANLFYHNFCEIKSLINAWMKSDDVTIKTMATSMNKKFEKYWKWSNLALAMAYFLDPRFKTKAVEYKMMRLYGKQSYHVHMEKFTAVINQFYQEYASFYKTAIAPTTNVNAEPKEIHTIDEANSDFMNYVYASSVDSGSDASDLINIRLNHPCWFLMEINLMFCHGGKLTKMYIQCYLFLPAMSCPFKLPLLLQNQLLVLRDVFLIHFVLNLNLKW